MVVLTPATLWCNQFTGGFHLLDGLGVTIYINCKLAFNSKVSSVITFEPKVAQGQPFEAQIANILFVHILMCKSQRRTAKIAANKFPTCTGQLLSLPWCLRGWGVMGMQSGRGRRSCHLLNCLVISLQRSNNVASLLRDSDLFQEIEQEESPQLLFLLKIIWHIHCSSNNDWYLG